jgi:phosphoglycolate phosphatase-like HAD superfamily hydrolase
MKVALFWDVDGTLLTTARAGVFSLEDALKQVTGRRADLGGMATDGLTDYAIVQAALGSVGHPADDATVQEFLRIHGEQLPRYLGRRRGHVMPGVLEVLEDLARVNEVMNLLLTGNIETGARAKLEHYGLGTFFTAGGAFCVDSADRVEIAHRATTLVHGAERVYVIGDTPNDLSAGEAIGAFTIAVATGSYSVEQLAERSPWRVLEQIPEPRAFRSLIGLPTTAA